MKKHIHLLPILTIVPTTIVPITACSSNNKLDIVNKNIEGEIAYDKEARFIFKINTQLIDNPRFEITISNLNVVDRFNQHPTRLEDNPFDPEVIISQDKKSLIVKMNVAQQRAIYAGCVASFNMNLKCLDQNNELWSQEFDDLSITYKYNLLIDDSNFITSDQCNTGKEATYRIKFKYLKDIYSPYTPNICINSLNSLISDYVITKPARSIDGENHCMYVSFKVTKKDGSDFKQDEVIPFYLELEYSDPTISSNNFLEYIPYLYVKHNECKLKQPTEVFEHTEPKRSVDYSAIISFDFETTDDYTFGSKDELDFSFDYNQRPMALSFFEVEQWYYIASYKKVHLEISTRVSSSIQVGTYLVDFNAHINNVTANWKQTLNPKFEFVVKEA